jgi:hypothetical protein
MRRPHLARLPWPAKERHRRPLRQLIWSVILVLVGLAVGLAAGQPFASRPVGQATVLVNPLPGNAFAARSVRATTELVDLKTEAQLAFSDQVLSKVRSLSGAPLNEVALRRRVSVKVANEAEVIVISYRGDTSVEATMMATQVADKFLAARTDNAQAAAVKRADVAQTALDKTQHDFDAASAGSDPEALTVLSQRINGLQRDLRAVSGVPPSPGAVLAASAPRSAEVRKVRVGLLVTSVLLAAFIGLRVGARPRHIPRWTRRLRLRLRRRITLHIPTQLRAR